MTWTSKGKTKTGKLSPDTGRVLVHSETWTARYKDEAGKTVEDSTKCRDKTAATRFLVKLENEVTQIRAGVLSREELNQAAAITKPVAAYLDQYMTKLRSQRASQGHIHGVFQRVNDLFADCQVTTLAEFDRAKMEKWMADAIEAGQRTPRTIKCLSDCSAVIS